MAYISEITIKDILIAIRDYLKVANWPSYVDRSLNRARVTAVLESGTVTTVSTVASVTNAASVGGYQGQMLVFGASQTAWAQCVRGRIG